MTTSEAESVFTQEDVELLDDEAMLRGFMALDAGVGPDSESIDRQKQRALIRLADRIAALLPPEEA